MYLREVRDILSATVLSGEESLELEVHSACGSDFMSDVLAYVKDQALLLTGLVNPQVVRTADMMDMKCIVFVRGKVPDQRPRLGRPPPRSSRPCASWALTQILSAGCRCVCMKGRSTWSSTPTAAPPRWTSA